jgi:hypothetical protein
MNASFYTKVAKIAKKTGGRGTGKTQGDLTVDFLHQGNEDNEEGVLTTDDGYDTDTE